MPELGPSPAPWSERWHKPVFIAFLLTWATHVVLLWLRVTWPARTSWLDAASLGLALGTTLVALGRRLPWQNVLMAASLIALVTGGVLGLNAATGVPFGPVRFSDRLGGRLFDVLPWPLPLLWVMVLLNARGVARLIMRPWRRTGAYGFWVIGLTGVLAVQFALMLEPFAVQVKGWWSWAPTRTPWLWYSAPWSTFLAWFALSVAILLFTTPWLINKQPGTRPMDYHPLILWLLLGAGLTVGSAAHALWPAVWVGLASLALVGGLAWRGGRWQRPSA